jgi:hypothetical protein
MAALREPLSLMPGPAMTPSRLAPTITTLAALLDVQSAVSGQAQFVNALKKGIEVDAAALEASRATDPARAEQLERLQAELGPRLEAAEAAAAAEAALEPIGAEERRKALLGFWKCPVQGPVDFTNSWGTARSGDRSHKGADMLAAREPPRWRR